MKCDEDPSSVAGPVAKVLEKKLEDEASDKKERRPLEV